MTDTDPRTAPTRGFEPNDPTDLLAMVPYLLGFHPEDSVVLLTVGDPPTPVHARQDLPDNLDEVPLVVHDLVQVTRRAGVACVAVVVYSGDERVAGAMAGALCNGVRKVGVDVLAAMRADGERWYCLGDDGEPCRRGCPSEGTRYDLSRHPLTLEAVVDGRVVLSSREALRDSLVGHDPDEVDEVAAAARSSERRVAAGGRAALVLEGRWVQRRVRRFVSDGRRLGNHDAGRLVAAITSTEVRDVAWAQMRRTDASRHVDLWRDVVRRCPRDALAPAAALLAFAAWLAGDGALAWCALDRCQEAEQGYGLAGLVTQTLAGAVPPTSWTPPGEGALSLFSG